MDVIDELKKAVRFGQGPCAAMMTLHVDAKYLDMAITALEESCKRAEDAEKQVAKHVKDLAECYRQSGADTDGNEDWRIAPMAVAEVTRLRQDHDQTSREYFEVVQELAAAVKSSQELASKDKLVLQDTSAEAWRRGYKACVEDEAGVPRDSEPLDEIGSVPPYTPPAAVQEEVK